MLTRPFSGSSGPVRVIARNFYSEEGSLLLKTQVSNKKPVLPKIRYSDINAKYEPPENKKMDVIKARKQKESEIIKAHENAEKQNVKDNKEKSTCSSKLTDITSAINDDETLKKVKESKSLFTDYQICLAERDELKKKLYEAQEILTKILTDICDNVEKINFVQKENSQKLDAMFDLLKQIADYIYSGTSRDEAYKQNTEE